MSVGQPATPAPTLPANGATDTPRSPTFTWTADSAAVNYTIEIATDSAFSTIVATGTPSTATYTVPTSLQPLTTYYWRVRANSPCGNSAMSQVFSFTTGVTFPEPYCTVTFPSAVEPITRVKFTGIDNSSSAAVGGSPAIEDFLGVPGGAVTPGSSYPLLVEGNTAGSYTTKIKAYIDWDHNGVFDASDGYVIGSLANSTGTDGKQVTANIAVPAGALPGPTRMRVIKKYSSDPAACNTSGYGQAEDYTLTVAGSNYTVGGSVSGLTGSGLALKLNGGNAFAISANGAFTLPGALASGASYAVTVATQPSGQTCALANGSGTIGSANVTNVAVTCAAAATYTVGGTVGGLTGSGLALKLNSGSAFAINVNGAFTLPGTFPSGASYAVTLAVQPLNPAQTCSVANGTGTIGSANVTSIAVTCVTNTYTVGGSVSGLTGSGLALLLNGSTNLPISTNGTFVFTGAIDSGATYAVTVDTQPANPTQICTVANGNGTIGAVNVTNVVVTCVTSTFAVGGTVVGLVGNGLKLSLNGGADLVISGNGAFVFPTPLQSGDSYLVTISRKPFDQICTLANESGTISSANVSGIIVTCTTISDRIFANDFEEPKTL